MKKIKNFGNKAKLKTKQKEYIIIKRMRIAPKYRHENKYILKNFTIQWLGSLTQINELNHL